MKLLSSRNCQRWPLLGLLVLFSVTTQATTPLFDKVEVDGMTGNLHQLKQGWLELPRSAKVTELVRTEQCSAIGGPRGIYSIENGHLWLQKLYSCRGTFELKDVFPDQDYPMRATWISGDLLAELGKPICKSKKGDFYIREFHQYLSVKDGQVMAVRKESNAEHSDCVKNEPEPQSSARKKRK